MKYGVALVEKPAEEGMSFAEMEKLFDMIAVGDGEDTERDAFGARVSTEVYPVELEAKEHESSAMGFISVDAAEKLGYDYGALRDYVASILDDMDKENPDGYYSFEGIDIFLTR